MSYLPSNLDQVEIVSAWNSSNQSLPTRTSGGEAANSQTFNLDTTGSGDISIVSNTVNLPEHASKAFFIGDLRSEGSGTTSGDIYSIIFDSNQGAFSSGGQNTRDNLQDDQCYSIDDTAKMRLYYVYRISGNTLAPWVRVLGVMI